MGSLGGRARLVLLLEGLDRGFPVLGFGVGDGHEGEEQSGSDGAGGHGPTLESGTGCGKRLAACILSEVLQGPLIVGAAIFGGLVVPMFLEVFLRALKPFPCHEVTQEISALRRE